MILLSLMLFVFSNACSFKIIVVSSYKRLNAFFLTYRFDFDVDVDMNENLVQEGYVSDQTQNNLNQPQNNQVDRQQEVVIKCKYCPQEFQTFLEAEHHLVQFHGEKETRM